jgi:hypothetical protein
VGHHETNRTHLVLFWGGFVHLGRTGKPLHPIGPAVSKEKVVPPTAWSGTAEDTGIKTHFIRATALIRPGSSSGSVGTVACSGEAASSASCVWLACTPSYVHAATRIKLQLIRCAARRLPQCTAAAPRLWWDWRAPLASGFRRVSGIRPALSLSSVCLCARPSISPPASPQDM